MFFVDEKASPEQRDALLEISSGKAGGAPFEILATTFSTLLEPRFVPFDFKLDGLRSSVRLGDRMRIADWKRVARIDRVPSSSRSGMRESKFGSSSHQ